MSVKTAALCLARLARPVEKMAGTVPLTAPPVSMGGYDPADFAQARLVFFILHGLLGNGFWYGDNALLVLSASLVERLPLKDALVFCGPCYGGGKSPMVEALFRAGASVVVTGTGKNITPVTLTLGTHWREWLERGKPALRAFQLAQYQTILKQPWYTGDIMSFTLLGRQSVTLAS